MSPRTEEAYVAWIRRFILFHRKRHPSEMGVDEVAAYLSWLATARQLSASTQNQALSALLFLYRDVLRIELPPLPSVVRARTPVRLPVVLTRSEVRAVLAELAGPVRLIGLLLYGAGLRLQEGLELRVKDLDFGRGEIVVRRGKGQKDRVTMLPTAARADLERHLAMVRRQHAADLAQGHGAVVLPFGLDRKYPHAATEWAWQFVFPAGRICRDAQYGPPSRFHLHESAGQRAVTAAVRRAGITKPASCHTFRHHADCRIMPMTAAS